MAKDQHQQLSSSSHHPPPIPADTPPSIPTRTRFNSTNATSRRRAGTGGLGSKRQSVPPAASPEVISNLITSLSGISKPADDYFEGKHLHSTTASTPVTQSTPATPIAHSTSNSKAKAAAAAGIGSFGVDYGAYKKPSLGDLREHPSSLDEIAASAPVIRTSKPTSGYSPLSPPKTPKSHSSRDGHNGGLRSFIRSSSTPSRASSSHDHDDTNSIGNLSIERHSGAVEPEPESHRRRSRSNDSWGRKASRSYKGLMYMTSKERLREKEDRKRSSGGGSSINGLHHSHSYGNLNGAGPSTQGGSNKPDPFLAETAISEEPSANEGVGTTNGTNRTMDSPRPIPHRDSSLRTSTAGGRRTSSRRPYRDGEGASATDKTFDEQSERRSRTSKKIPSKLDLDPAGKVRASSASHSRHHSRNNSGPETPNTQKFLETIRDDYLAYDSHSPGQEDDDGAPFPAVSQNRRRSVQSLERGRRKGSVPSSPGWDADGRPKRRSSSRLKGLSRQTSPSGSRKASEDIGRDDTVGGGAPLERLDSVDSIDDAVDSYLCSPRLTQKIRHPQTGRTICFSEVGDSEGSAVFCCVGMGLTRYITAFYDELALTLKLRLITPDRPGVGESGPYGDGATTPLNWPDDVYAICQALKITKFSILAHSAGAIYALATALRMPQHIRGRIHLLAPWIPPSQMNVFGNNNQTSLPTNSIPTSQRILRALPTPVLKVANSSFMSATSTSITTSLPKNPRRAKRRSTGAPKDSNANKHIAPTMDKENFSQMERKKSTQGDVRNGGAIARSQSMTEGMNQRSSSGNIDIGGASGEASSAVNAMVEQERQITYDTRLTHAIWELATTGANPAVDLLICLERRHTIGFRYVDINRPVIIHHGSRDTRVPVDNVRWLGKTMRRCEVRVLEGEGHGLMASAGVMGSVLMEISKEWEDWMRVTGAENRKDKERGRRGTLRG